MNPGQIYYQVDPRVESIVEFLRTDFSCRPITPDCTWMAPAVALVTSPLPVPEDAAIILVFGGTTVPDVPAFAFLPADPPIELIRRTIQSAFEHLDLAGRLRETRRELEQSLVEIEELNGIGIALSLERDTPRLLGLILLKMREISRSDAGSLYLVEDTDSKERRLRFKLVQNDSIPVQLKEFTLAIDSSSVAGYVALTGETVELEDAHKIPEFFPFKLNLRMDKASGYRTRSMVVLPMKNVKGEILGVIQLINCKRVWAARVSDDNAERIVIPYPEAVVRTARSLSSQAAVALENNHLYQNIEDLFESFVKASIVAIEARDPTTSGHSFRVAQMTVGLAEAIDRTEHGPYRELRFNREQIKELRYASLLHDFGKVGVREDVLVKAKKLYPWQLDLIRQRFAYVRRTLLEEQHRHKLDYLLEKGRDQYLLNQEILDSDFEEHLKEVDELFRLIIEYNEPTVLPQSDFRRLVEMASMRYEDWNGEHQPLITSDELRMLSIPKGSLDDSERLQIESHVFHTYNFLRQMPWTRELRAIPLIARAHHEKLDGTGYPFRLKDAEIPVQSKMMTIADIYDALVASDRPYKRAVRSDTALDIIDRSVRQNQLDTELFRVFVQAGIYKNVHK